MIKLILVRHGETKWTEEKCYQGTSDIPLSKKGIEQAKKIAKRLKKEKIDVAYTSKLKRAIQTAQAIIKFRNIKLIKTEKLNERSYGKWESLTEDEVKERYPTDHARYKKEKYKTRPTKGESLFDLRKRIEPFIKKVIKENKNKTLLIVSHNCPLRIIVGVLMGYNEEKIASLYFKLTSLTLIMVDNKKCSLELINCNKHNK